MTLSQYYRNIYFFFTKIIWHRIVETRLMMFETRIEIIEICISSELYKQTQQAPLESIFFLVTDYIFGDCKISSQNFFRLLVVL